jgi:hypothetical protein
VIKEIPLTRLGNLKHQTLRWPSHHFWGIISLPPDFAQHLYTFCALAFAKKT